MPREMMIKRSLSKTSRGAQKGRRRTIGSSSSVPPSLPLVPSLKYFWVETCCLDKSSNAKLQEAVTSMFRRYQNAARYYVYLRDV
ncbi:hypothetical protein F4677DRAFT_414002 [Hypoxylon crocopeplum]|nr:hypothetical protein F4677DRAFT_414002 [Hypoxylon crocopeplum]